jgi:hypothetical protein
MDTKYSTQVGNCYRHKYNQTMIIQVIYLIRDTKAMCIRTYKDDYNRATISDYCLDLNSLKHFIQIPYPVFNRELEEMFQSIKKELKH